MARDLLQAVPHWPIPRDERRQLAKPSPRLVQHFHKHQDGLAEMRLYIVRGAEIQRWHVRGPADPDFLAAVVWLRGERQARRTGKQVKFRLHLMGRTDDGPFEKQAQFSINPADFLPDDEQEDEELSDEDRSPEIDNPIEDEHNDRSESSDDFEEIDPAYDGMSEFDDDDGTGAIARRGTVDVARGPHPEGYISPEMLLQSQAHAQAQTLHLAHRAYSAPMKENRMLVHEFRQEMSATIRDIKLNAQMQLSEHMRMTNKLLEHQTHMFQQQGDRYDKMIGYWIARTESLEKQQAESNKLNAAHIHNFQELAKQGWQAFLDAMKMKSTVLDEQIEWASHAAEEMQRMQPAAKERSGPHWLIQAGSSPMLMGGLSMVMRSLGKHREADMMENLATNASRARVADDDDDDDDEGDEGEDEQPTASAPNGSSQAGFAGAGAPGRPKPTPFADRARAFRASLSDQQLTKFRGILPRKAVRAFDAACGAADDTVAIEGLRTLKAAVEKDMSVVTRLAAELDEAQLTEIMAVVEAIDKVPGGRQRRQPPPRPTAD